MTMYRQLPLGPMVLSNSSVFSSGFDRRMPLVGGSACAVAHEEGIGTGSHLG